MKKKFLFGVAIKLFAMLAATAAIAQTYPTKPIRIIVPYSPGGTTDQLARIIGKNLTARWGQPVIVENRPGANGMIGTDVVAKAPPDGYTIGVASPGTHAANASLYPGITHDIIKDFTPITLAVMAPLVLVAHPSLNVKSVQELIPIAKSKPGAISYAAGGGTGSSMHLAMAQFNNMAGLSMTLIPYKGSTASYPDLLSGRVSLQFDVLPTAMPYVKTGELLALAVSSSKRLPQMPTVPTVAEAGLPAYESSSWYGFVGPANIPKDILNKLHGAIVETLKTPEVTEALTKAGVMVVASTPEQFATHIQTETAKAAKVIKEANIKLE